MPIHTWISGEGTESGIASAEALRQSMFGILKKENKNINMVKVEEVREVEIRERQFV